MSKPVDETQLKGTTLRVYLLLLNQKQPIGVRELQRELGLSSPSVAQHHLTKLQRLELCDKSPDAKYTVSRRLKIGVLRQFVEIRGQFLPRYVFHVAFFVSLLLSYSVFTFFTEPGDYDRLVTFGALSVAATVSTYEAFRLYRELRIDAQNLRR